MAMFTGTAGDDTQNGTSDADIFDYFQGGKDTLNGRGGSDTFRMGTALGFTDRLDGGSGNDLLQLFGATGIDYIVAYNNSTLKSIETIQFSAGDYTITMADGNVALGATFTVLGSAATRLTFDGSAETDGRFFMNTSSGDDVLIGGAQDDIIDCGSPFFTAGSDTVNGGGGNDTLKYFDDSSPGDRIDGGDGYDVLTSQGAFEGELLTVHFSNSALKNVEEIDLDANGVGAGYDVLISDGNIGAGETLIIHAETAESVTFSGYRERDGNIHVYTGTDSDNIFVGRGDDYVEAGGEADIIQDMGGNDVFAYRTGSDSTGRSHDGLVYFDSREDSFLVPAAVTGIDPRVTHGTLTFDAFDADLAARIDAGRLAEHHAVLYRPDAGDYSGLDLLIVDVNGTAGYQLGDLIIQLELTSHLAELGLENFGVI